MKYIIGILLGSVLGIVGAHAYTTSANRDISKELLNNYDTISFQGKIEKVDASAKTFTILLSDERGVLIQPNRMQFTYGNNTLWKRIIPHINEGYFLGVKSITDTNISSAQVGTQVLVRRDYKKNKLLRAEYVLLLST